jgi:hypothetical protein
MPRTTTSGKAKAGPKLDAIERKIGKARERLREIESEARAAQDAVARADEALADLYRTDPENEAEEKRLLEERAVAIARRDDVPWAAKIHGQRGVVERLQGEAEAFVRSHYGELVAEQTPGAEEKRTTLIECLRAVVPAIDEYEQGTTRAVQLAIAGGNTDDVPRLHGADQLKQAVRQMLAREIPLPLPGAFTNEPEGDPEPRRIEAAVSDLDPSEVEGG